MSEPSFYDLAKKYVDAVEYDEEHPDDPNSEASAEYAMDLLVERLAKVGFEKSQLDERGLVDTPEVVMQDFAKAVLGNAAVSRRMRPQEALNFSKRIRQACFVEPVAQRTRILEA